MTVQILRDRVQGGVNLLDRTVPDWDQRINTRELNIAHVSCCILGQLFGDYGLGLFKLHLDKKSDTFTCSSSMGKALGFEGDVSEMQILNHLWREVIHNRHMERVVVEMAVAAEKPVEELVCA